MMIVPTQWRDYKSKKEMLKSFNSNEDFRVCCPVGEYSKWDTMACNKKDLINFSIKEVAVRYNKLQEKVIINVKEKNNDDRKNEGIIPKG